MPEAYNRSTELILKYFSGELNEQEKNEFDRLLAGSIDLRELVENLHDPEWLMNEIKIFYEPDVDGQREKVLRIIKHRRIVRWRWAAAAAVFIIGLGIGYWWLNQSQHAVAPVPETASEKAREADLPPGRAIAELILADGSKIDLDQAKTGRITVQGNTVVLNKDDGLYYEPGPSTASKEVLYNTLNAPAGGIYKVVLPDGTTVWLNAASSLRYPVSFTGSERNVELTGEGYFDVAKLSSDKGQPVPFKVRTKRNVEVQELGTHFNINAYDDEDTLRTTLLEGAVQVSIGSQRVVLHRGQQAGLANTDTVPGAGKQIIITRNIDTTKLVDWKKGAFNFKNDDIKTVMRQIQRWYNVKVDYNFNYDKVHKKVNALVSRNMSLKNALGALLNDTNIHAIIDEKDRKVILSY